MKKLWVSLFFALKKLWVSLFLSFFFLEVGRRRVPASALPTLAQTFGISVDELIGSETKQAAKKRGPVSTLHRQVDQITLMPRAKQKFISEMLEALIQQQRSA
ncbi:hypothetical protein [Aliikangiella sp. IMCC44632]